jgi:hypothetical protein
MKLSFGGKVLGYAPLGAKSKTVLAERCGCENTWWRTLNEPRKRLIVQVSYGTSDGGRAHCCLYDPRNASFRNLAQGWLECVSPDGKWCAYYNDDWIGPYKRGGERLGTLQIVSIATGQQRALTKRMVRIDGADWRRPVK